MPNTSNAKMVALSSKVYKEWVRKTVLVQSCDNSFQGELNLKTREIDIPVYHTVSIHKTTLKERHVKPVDPEVIRASTKRVVIDKGRYSHWMDLTIDELVDDLSKEKSENRKMLVNKWARDAETELAIWIAKLPEDQQIDLTDTDIINGGVINKDNVLLALDVLKAHATTKNYDIDDFEFFTSEKFETILRDSKILLGSNMNGDAEFRNGFVGNANGVQLRKHQVPDITTRDAKSKIVNAEWGIFKTRDGVQYVVPFRTTVQYDIEKSKVLLGGTGYQMVEYYDFFNLYKGRLLKVKMSYKTGVNPPTTFTYDTQGVE